MISANERRMENVELALDLLPAPTTEAREPWKRQLCEDVQQLRNWLEWHTTTGDPDNGIDLAWAEAGIRILQRITETEELTKP